MTTRLIELAIPLVEPFATGAGSIDERHTMLVGRSESGITGWGEAAPFPGVTPDTVDGVWASLRGETTALTPTAAAALEEAEADLGARIDGQPLWKVLGTTPRPVLTSLAIGLAEDPIKRLEATGAGAVKLKIIPGDDVRRVEVVRNAYPDLPISVDANGAYSWEDRDALLALDRFDVTDIEQPFAPGDLESHAALREEVLAAVSIDEPIDTVAAAVEVIEAGAAGIIVVKPSRIGLEACRTIHDVALAAGLRVKASGLVETAVGRAHTLAVALLPGAVYPDVADDAWFFETATGVPPPLISGGWVSAPDAPGIGVDPDLEALAPYIVRETTTTRSADQAPG